MSNLNHKDSVLSIKKQGCMKIFLIRGWRLRLMRDMETTGD